MKVQKRGSVGRTIDVNRYKGYDELRNDLARMFGIEGLLEDPQRTEWKLVYVDHENDILLVGDDPWEYVYKKLFVVFFCPVIMERSITISFDFCRALAGSL